MRLAASGTDLAAAYAFDGYKVMLKHNGQWSSHIMPATPIYDNYALAVAPNGVLRLAMLTGSFQAEQCVHLALSAGAWEQETVGAPGRAGAPALVQQGLDWQVLLPGLGSASRLFTRNGTGWQAEPLTALDTFSDWDAKAVTADSSPLRFSNGSWLLERTGWGQLSLKPVELPAGSLFAAGFGPDHKLRGLGLGPDYQWFYTAEP
jgi:hypothetical protein